MAEFYFNVTDIGSDNPWRSGPFDSKSDAIKAALLEWEEYKGLINIHNKDLKDYFQVGQLENHIPHISSDSIIDYLRERAYDEHGEVSDDWLMDIVSNEERELEDSLNTVLAEWLTKVNANPKFGSIAHIENFNVSTVKKFSSDHFMLIDCGYSFEDVEKFSIEDAQIELSYLAENQ